MNNIVYDILYIVGGLLLYTLIVYFGYRHSHNEHKRALRLVLILKEVIEEIKHIVTKEENGMEEKEVKLTLGGLYIGKGSTPYPDTFSLEPKEIKNRLTLTDLLDRKPTDAEYFEIIQLLSQLARQTYEEYKFLVAKSHDETEQPNFMQIISNSKDNPEMHKLIFAKGLDCGIDMRELQKRFAIHIALDTVIPLGKDVVVITDDNTGQPPTGVSPINNGLEGGEICFIISFMKKENFEQWQKNTFGEEKADE